MMKKIMMSVLLKFNFLLMNVPISLFLLGALTSSIFYDLMLSASRKFLPMQSLFYILRWITLVQLICQALSYYCESSCLQLPRTTPAVLELIVIVAFSLMISCTTIDQSSILTIGNIWFVKIQVENSDADPNLSLHEQVELDIHNLREKLRSIGIQTLKSLLCFTCVSYSVSMISHYYQDQSSLSTEHQPSAAGFLHLLLSISNYAHGRYCHAMIYRLVSEIEEKSRIEIMTRTKSQEHNKLKFMQFVLHEVRVPLNSIVLGLDIMATEESLTEEMQETVDMMKQSASFMVATLNDVLSWQKVEQGIVKLDLAPLSPNRLVQSVVASFRVAIEQKQMRISVLIDENVPQCVRGDFHRLQHVLANLMSNAIKFSPQSSLIEVHVSISNHGEHSTGQMLRFSVRDEGIGISVEDQKGLFSPYMQISPQETQGGKGTGLGLSICKGIVKAHHGEIGCYSRETASTTQSVAGSEFYFLVPLDALDPSLCSEEQPINSLGLSHLLDKVSHKGPAHSTVETDDAEIQVNADELEECEWPYKWWLTQHQNHDTAGNNSTSSRYLSCDSCESASTMSLDTFPSVNGPPSAVTSSSFSFPGTAGAVNSTTSSFFTASDSQNALILAPIHVLICDDVVTNRKMLERVVAKKTLRCDCCCNGSEAVDAVTNKGINYYDLIFMDNVMPVMCGLEATQRIRERGFRKLIVGVTGSAMDTETNAFADCGADVVLAKPVHMETLHRLLRNCNQYGTISPSFIIDDDELRDLQRRALDGLRS